MVPARYVQLIMS